MAASDSFSAKDCAKADPGRQNRIRKHNRNFGIFAPADQLGVGFWQGN
jgi:hypothetical protein